MKSFSWSSTTSTASHPYALLLEKMVEVDSFSYFRDEHVEAVSYIYRT